MSQLANGNRHFNAADRIAIDFQGKTVKPEMFHRIANHEIDAVNECMQTYGDLIWTIAKQKSRSVSGAEQLTQEIFACIWRSAKNFDPAVFSSKNFVLLITRHCLKEWESKNSTSRSPDAKVQTPSPTGIQVRVR